MLQCFISDEILAYQFSSLLGLDNIPIAMLVQYNESSLQWQAVAKAAVQANWSDGMIVPVMQWIYKLNGKG